jgi:tetrahydromethanopterin S-methyltransferase subunit G
MSDDEGKVLSQSDIDAMLSTAQEEPAGPKKTASAVSEEKPPAEKKPAPAAEQVPVEKPAEEAPAVKPSGESKSQEVLTVELIENLESTLADLVKRLGTMENAMERLDKLEKQVEENSGASPAVQSEELEEMKSEVQDLSEQMDEISGNLKYSLGYGVGKIFQCKHCESKELVALHVKCTDCGEETWLGWWPRRG